MSSNKLLARNIAGEITISDNPALTLRKWREVFGLSQVELARFLEISPSVISDYESGARKSPGIVFIRRWVKALISLDIKKGEQIIKKFSIPKSDAILDVKEFLSPITAKKLVKTVHGRVVSNNDLLDRDIHGYTIVDSIKAILELSKEDFAEIYGTTTQRALIFTKVHTGRSPMVALRIAKPRPSLVVLHGLNHQSVDKLAIKISMLEKIPLVVSAIKSEEELVSNLGGLME